MQVEKGPIVSHPSPIPEAAAARALEYVKDGDVVGLGTGHAAVAVVLSSRASASLAASASMSTRRMPGSRWGIMPGPPE